MLLNLLQKRYSCRNFSSKIITDEIINYILECGRLSASGGNAQPWKFGVITDVDIIKKISEAASVNYNQDWISNAPLIIILCTKIYDSKSDYNLNRFPSIKNKVRELEYHSPIVFEIR